MERLGAASRQWQGIPAHLWYERLRQVLSPASRAAAFHHAAWCRGWHQFLAPLSGPPVGGNLIQSHHWLRGWLAKAPSLSWLANRQRWLNSVASSLDRALALDTAGPRQSGGRRRFGPDATATDRCRRSDGGGAAGTQVEQAEKRRNLITLDGSRGELRVVDRGIETRRRILGIRPSVSRICR